MLDQEPSQGTAARKAARTQTQSGIDLEPGFKRYLGNAATVESRPAASGFAEGVGPAQDRGDLERTFGEPFGSHSAQVLFGRWQEQPGLSMASLPIDVANCLVPSSLQGDGEAEARVVGIFFGLGVPYGQTWVGRLRGKPNAGTRTDPLRSYLNMELPVDPCRIDRPMASYRDPRFAALGIRLLLPGGGTVEPVAADAVKYATPIDSSPAVAVWFPKLTRTAASGFEPKAARPSIGFLLFIREQRSKRRPRP